MRFGRMPLLEATSRARSQEGLTEYADLEALKAEHG